MTSLCTLETLQVSDFVIGDDKNISILLICYKLWVPRLWHWCWLFSWFIIWRWYYILFQLSGRVKEGSRKKDFADTDLKLALNACIQFQTPEKFFLGSSQMLHTHLNVTNSVRLCDAVCMTEDFIIELNCFFFVWNLSTYVWGKPKIISSGT